MEVEMTESVLKTKNAERKPAGFRVLRTTFCVLRPTPDYLAYAVYLIAPVFWLRE